jgi:hypothetical protein
MEESFLALAAMASSGVEYGRLFLASDVQARLVPFFLVASWVYLAVTFLSSIINAYTSTARGPRAGSGLDYTVEKKTPRNVG